jgi:hypothetical protein
VRGEDGVFRRENHGADHIAGEEVGSELDAFAVDAEGGAEGFDEERFSEARHAFEEDVAVGEEGQEEAFDDVGLANDGLGNFVPNFF